MTTPAKSALDEARERLEHHSLFYGYRVVDGKHVECRTVEYADLRLVLDALKEAERKLANERSKFAEYRPALVCEGCHRVVKALRDGLCDPCFLEGIPQ